ncbi:hypothetical protein J5N97_006282 [Dioscorea zingiberensis]|uniref:Uncharacterized protein n=1 Tax=Dioscorea zingiberensis TaxID=325984 RepID=A0A9D5DA05_9LILI|nr:hypothetical protein J5N97_006282 [Dioscorea zingiberensis]
MKNIKLVYAAVVLFLLLLTLLLRLVLGNSKSFFLIASIEASVFFSAFITIILKLTYGVNSTTSVIKLIILTIALSVFIVAIAVISCIRLGYSTTFYIIGGVDILLLLVLCSCLCCKRDRRKGRYVIQSLSSSSLTQREDFPLEYSHLRYVAGLPKNFRYEELAAATNNFQNQIGRGGSGSVFKGVLSDGSVLAVKRIEGEVRGEREFWNELVTIASVQHFNLVRLIGCCLVPGNHLRFLVYEFIENGSLDSWIFKKNNGGEEQEACLTWALRIASEKLREGKVMEVVDERLKMRSIGVEEEKEVKALVCIALWCIQEKPELRPSMELVVDMLERHVDKQRDKIIWKAGRGKKLASFCYLSSPQFRGGLVLVAAIAGTCRFLRAVFGTVKMLHGSSSIGSGAKTNGRTFEFGRTHVVRPKGRHQATIVWLHGLGDNGASWSQILESLPLPNIKWICPTAPTRPVAIFGGFRCPAWFDVMDITEETADDLEGLDASAAHVANLLSTEPADIKLGVGGFSMGAAIALFSASCCALGKYRNGTVYPVNIGATVGLSGWLPASRSHKIRMGESQEAVARAASLPILLCHGKGDDVVLYKHGERSYEVLKSTGFNVTFRSYTGLGHYTVPEEMDTVCKWLTATLGLDGSQP